MYNLELDSHAMLHRLEESHADAIIQADIPATAMFDVLGIKEPGKIQIFFQRGEIVNCSLSTTKRMLFVEKEQVLRALTRIGKLRWQLSLPLEGFAPPFAETSPALAKVSPFAFVPYRIRSVSLDQLPDAHKRRVYLLIDGKRSIERIAELVHLKKEDTLTIIQTLRDDGIVGIVDR